MNEDCKEKKNKELKIGISDTNFSLFQFMFKIKI